MRPTRSIGLYNDKVIVPTMQGKLYGLDASTGKIVWQSWISDPSKPDEGQHGNTGGVIVAHGKAIVGMTNCGRIPQNNHCYISAYDANTGKRVWKFVTVALKGEPGGDTWGDLPDDQRAGAETWIAGTYDPELNTTYWGTAQAKPWRRDLRGSGDGATALCQFDPGAGSRYRQAEMVFQPCAGRELRPGRSVRAHPDRSWRPEDADDHRQGGILWKLDRVTGKYLDSRETVFQNVYHQDRSQDRHARPTARTSSTRKWTSGCPPVPAPKAARTGRRRAITSRTTR